MKNKVCIVVTIIMVMMLAQLTWLIGSTNAYTVKGGYGDDEYYFDSESSTLKLTVKGKLNTDYDYVSQFAEIVKNVIIEEGLTVIEAETFQGCKNLTNIDIPSSVETIEVNAFIDCKSLESINVSGSNKYYCSVDGVLYNKDKTEIICYPQNKSNASYKILDGVTSIGNYAFYGNKNINNIEFSNGLRSIGDSAFEKCIGLTNLKIPNTVNTISTQAFFECTGLTNVEIPNSVTSIKSNAFWGCEGLTSIEIPDSIEIIEANTFLKCTGLTNVKIPNSVKQLKDGSFSGCTNLKSIDIPDSVTSIGYGSFASCTELTKIMIPNSVTEFRGYTFYKCDDLTIYCKSDSKAKTYAVENNHSYIIDDEAPQINLSQEGNKILVKANDGNGVGVQATSIDNKVWSSINQFVAEKTGTYTIYAKDKLGNLAHKEITVDLDKPIINDIKIEELKITVSAKDELSGLAERAYSLDGENWQSSNEFVVNKAGKYTIYIRDVEGNIATKTVEVVANKEDDKTEKEDNTSTGDDKTKEEDKIPADNGNKNTNSKTSTEMNDVKKAEDKTQAKTLIPQTGATFPIVILIIVSVIGVVGYKKFKKVNY